MLVSAVATSTETMLSIAATLGASSGDVGAALSVTVADARFAKPLDEELIMRVAREHEAVITVEEGSVGGFGAFVLQMLAARGVLDRGVKIRTLTLPDTFQDHDKPDAMYADAGLDAEGIVKAALQALGLAGAKANLRA